MLKKIHCDLLDIHGPKWSQISKEKVRCVIDGIHDQKLLGNDEELYGFVGTIDHEQTIGGYFVIQYPTQLLTFKPDKTPLENTTTPAETILFVLFPEEGRILLQIRRFQILPINMEVVRIKLIDALTRILKRCDIGYVLSLDPTKITITREELIREFKKGYKVTYLSVSDPQAERIPEDITYYNPQRERNKIIRDSRLHDYHHFKRVDLTARAQSDLRNTHFGKDLVYSVSDDGPFQMKYQDEHGETKKIVRQKNAKYEFYLDIDEKQLTKESLLKVHEIVNQDPLSQITSRDSTNEGPQIPLFGQEGDTNNDE